MKTLRLVSAASVFLAFMISFGLSSASAAQAILIDRLEAAVNSEIILNSDVSDFRKTLPLRAQLDPLFAGTTLASKGPGASDEEIIAFLTDERLIAQQFPISDTEVEQEITSIQATNRIDRSALRSALKERGFEFEDYFDLIRTSAAKRNLIDRDIRTKVTISEDDIKNYYYNHYNKGSGGSVAYQVRIITVSPGNYKTASAAKEAAQKAVQQLQSGEAFEEVAKRVSDDPSASTGGDLGILTDDQMSPAIRSELKKLRIGQTSGLLGNSNSGFYILKLADIKSNDTDRFDKVKEEIRNQLIAAEYQHQISLWLDRQRQNAFLHRAGKQAP